MINYWTNLSERDRLVAIIAATCLFIFLFYQYIYSPIVGLSMSKTEELNEKSSTLAWIQETKQKTQNLGNGKPISNGRLLGIIATELNKKPFSTFPHQIQQTSQGNIQITFDTVPIKAFLLWLWALENTYVITIKQLDVSRTPTAGVVKMMVVIDANPQS